MHRTFFPKKLFSAKMSVYTWSPPVWSLFLFFLPLYPDSMPPPDSTTSSISTLILPCSNLYHSLIKTMSFAIRKSRMWILTSPLTRCVHLGLSVLISKTDRTIGLTTGNYYKDHKRQWGKELRTVLDGWEVLSHW